MGCIFIENQELATKFDAIEGISLSAVESMSGEFRSKTWQAVNDIASFIVPGMSEIEAIKKANQLFASRGVKKFWHKTHIRFGESTVKSFLDPYAENVVLKQDDIFYVDVGPIWDGIEGDCGKTFVVGSDPEKIKISKDVEILFNKVKEFWLTEKPEGVALLKYAQIQTLEMGYLLHPSYVKGHRLSEFPHAIYSKNSLYDFQATPSPARWVLEFQICNPEMSYGAFYEDLLI